MIDEGYTIYFNNRPIGQSLIDKGYSGSYFIDKNELHFTVINAWGEHEGVKFYMNEKRVVVTFDNGGPTEYFEVHQQEEDLQIAINLVQKQLGWI